MINGVPGLSDHFPQIKGCSAVIDSCVFCGSARTSADAADGLQRNAENTAVFCWVEPDERLK